MRLPSRRQSCTGECQMAIMETKSPVPRAILVGVQVPDVDDVAHAASIEELGRLVKTLGYEVVGTISQKRDEIGGGTVLGKGRLEELAGITGGTGVVGSMARPRKSKAASALKTPTRRSRISNETTISVGPRVAINSGSHWSATPTQGSRR